MKQYYYLKEKVSIGQTINIDGLTIVLTQDIIDSNPNKFELIENNPPPYVEILINEGYFKEGEILRTEVYNDKEGWRFVWRDNSGQLYCEEYKDYYKASTKEAYDKQELLIEAKERFPTGTKYIPAHMKNRRHMCTVNNPKDFYFENTDIQESLGNISKNGHAISELIYYDGVWAKRYVFTTEEGIDIYEGDEYYIAEKNQPVEPMKGVYGRIHISGVSFKSFFYIHNAEEYLITLNDKTLQDYESILLDDESLLAKLVNNKGHSLRLARGMFYKVLKLEDSKAYYTKVLKLIADDLNDEWYPNWNNDENKYYIERNYGIYEINCCFHYNNSSVCFKTEELAKKAIEIMGAELINIFK